METPTDSLLARYLAGELAPDEADAVERWAAMDASNRLRLDRLGAVWSARTPVPPPDVPRIWAGVRRSMRAGRARPVPLGRHARWERRRWPAAAIAAAATLVAASLVFLVTGPRATTPDAAAEPEAREYATARGQRATIQLPDGSRLVLGPGSRLRIPGTFGRAAREVDLHGDAMFDVVHDSTRPFRVHSRFAVAEVIGTRFVVRAFDEDSVVAVAVAEGAVALGRAAPAGASAADAAPGAGAAQGVVLQAGELGSLDSTGRVRTARGEALDAYLGWAEGRLSFVDTPLAEAARRLGRWYDVDVRVASPALGARPLTATFRDESTPEALRFVATVLSLELVRDGDRYTLRAK